MVQEHQGQKIPNLSIADIVASLIEVPAFTVKIFDHAGNNHTEKIFFAKKDAMLAGFKNGQWEPQVKSTTLFKLPSGEIINYPPTALGLDKVLTPEEFRVEITEVLRQNPSIHRSVHLLVPHLRSILSGGLEG